MPAGVGDWPVWALSTPRAGEAVRAMLAARRRKLKRAGVMCCPGDLVMAMRTDASATGFHHGDLWARLVSGDSTWKWCRTSWTSGASIAPEMTRKTRPE